MAAVAGNQETQATQLQLLVLHQLYKPYISGESNFLSSLVNIQAAFETIFVSSRLSHWMKSYQFPPSFPSDNCF